MGIATLGEPKTYAEFERWLSRGFAGEMAYLERGAEKPPGFPFAATTRA